ncbi:hypothetical protein CMI45_00960 [Candidatus Pacearchaeota archaeon]|nr:hypothetical protein [Candidatus Pacearchaeota archaeon]|tara:strand:+ start:2045 stop:2653 length:609 start_codon:yes stop_codon:yes gene_type:complete
MNLKNLALGIGIIVVFALALGYGIEAFYDTPEWDEFCEEVIVPQTLDSQGDFAPVTQEQCEATEGAKWNTYEDSRTPKRVLEGQVVETGHCDYHSECQEKYDDARDKHSWTVFLISIIVGIIAIIIGYTILSIEPVGSALIGSGIWAFFYGGVINWRNFGEMWRFVLLFIILIVLIWFAVKMNSPKKNGISRFWKGFGFGKK